MLKIGLTGGIASGKSMVADLFAKLGAALVDTDALAREVVAPRTPGLEAVRKLFGPSVVTASGELDRPALRSIVFADAAKRRHLEDVLHPLIRERTLQSVSAARGPYVIVVVPLLVETYFAQLVDRVLVVDCPVETQLDRLVRRDGIARVEAEAMVAAQTDRASRLDAADDVIDNSGSIEHARKQVEALHRHYLALSADQ